MGKKFYLRHEKAILIAAVATFFVAGYLGISLVTSRLHAHSLAFPIDRTIPYVPALWPLYQCVYLLVLLPTRLFSRPREMRAGAAANMTCMAAAYVLFLLFPVRLVAPSDAREALAAGLARPGGNFAIWFDDQGMNCFPSLHVALATIASACCWRADRRLGAVAWILTAAIAAASLFVKRHYVIDLPAGVVLGAGAYRVFLRGRLGAPSFSQ